jgi:hypothetical protein
MATGTPGELALASNRETMPATRRKRLVGGELEIEFEHGRLRL